MKQCPFCGSDNLKQPERNILVLWVECLNCGAQGPIYNVHYGANQQFEISEALAIDLWDERK
jgi:Lar family restriction alleviation protein